jgi:hypothetical protein
VSLPYDVLMAVLDRLLQACENLDLPAIVAILHELPLDYAPLSTDISDLIWGAEQTVEEPGSVTIEAGVRA